MASISNQDLFIIAWPTVILAAKYKGCYGSFVMDLPHVLLRGKGVHQLTVVKVVTSQTLLVWRTQEKDSFSVL